MRFSQIIGQYSIKERLIRSVNENRVSHAQLFFGNEGVGALPLAVAYAQYVNCEEKGDVDSCGKCLSCIKYQKLIHPDLHFIVPVAKSSEKKKDGLSSEYMEEWREAFLSNPYLGLNEWLDAAGLENKQGLISTDEANTLVRKMSLKSYEAPYKVCIIWQPERFHNTAANKLLKSFEEPADRTLFILVSEAFDQLLPTILSRTQLIKIPQIAESDLMMALQNKHGLSEHDAQRIVHLSEGNYNEAIKLISEDIALMDYEKYFMEWMRLCFRPSKNFKKLLDWIDDAAKLKREGLKSFFSFSLETCRQCMMINYADDSLIRFDEKYFTGLHKFAPFVNQHNADGFCEEFSKAYYHIERNAYAKILLLDLSFKIHKLLSVVEK